MNKKLLALLVVGATAGQTARAVDIKGFFKAANALLNPVDFTGEMKQGPESAKYDVLVHNDAGTNRHVIDQAGKVGFIDGADVFQELEAYDVTNAVAKANVENGKTYYVQKNAGNVAKIDNENGVTIVTRKEHTTTVEMLGREKVDAFFGAQDAHKDNATRPGGKTSEAIWGFRQGVIGKWKANGLVAAGWLTVIGSYLLGRSMAKADSDDDDNDDDEEGDTK